ncbi:MAG TPA: CBS domain-containing protein [Nevskiaceae bacterium]|nr:CBS domain-containing protein [Nevskiaceae bacterium]
MEEMVETGRIPHTLGDLMTHTLITVAGEESVHDAMHLMADNAISSLVVQPNAKGEWGILTRRDIVLKIVRGNRSPLNTKVNDICSRPVKLIPADTSIRDGSQILADANFSRLIVGQGDKPIGIVTETDIFQAVEKFGWAGESVA